MKERNKLTLQMSLLFLIVFVVFGVIIVNEKLSPLKIPKVTEKMTTYLKTNYQNDLSNLKMTEVEYKKMRYQCKVTSKHNSNYYFYIYYEDKKMTDTYKKDYVQGESILNYQKNKIIKNIKKKTKTTYKVSINKNLDKYTDSMKEKIINTDKPECLKIYNLEANITVSVFNTKHITNTLKAFNSNFENKDITPKYYSIIIMDQEDEEKALKITNITSDIINSNDFTNIINDIINKKKSNLLDTYDIEYEYLN